MLTKVKSWLRQLKQTLLGLTLLFLTVFSASCAERPLVIEKPVPVAPPAQYYAQDCPETFVALLVNKDLAEKINALRADLGRCNADRAAIRSWKEELQD